MNLYDQFKTIMLSYDLTVIQKDFYAALQIYKETFTEHHDTFSKWLNDYISYSIMDGFN